MFVSFIRCSDLCNYMKERKEIPSNRYVIFNYVESHRSTATNKVRRDEKCTINLSTLHSVRQGRNFFKIFTIFGNSIFFKLCCRACSLKISEQHVIRGYIII